MSWLFGSSSKPAAAAGQRTAQRASSESSNVVTETEYYNGLMLELVEKWTTATAVAADTRRIDIDQEALIDKRKVLLDRMDRGIEKLLREIDSISGHNDVAEKVEWRLRALNYQAFVACAREQDEPIVPALRCDGASIVLDRMAAFFHELIPLEGFARLQEKRKARREGNTPPRSEKGPSAEVVAELSKFTGHDTVGEQRLLGVSSEMEAENDERVMRVLRGNLADRVASCLGARNVLENMQSSPVSSSDDFLLSYYQRYVKDEAMKWDVPWNDSASNTQSSPQQQQSGASHFIAGVQQQDEQKEVAIAGKLEAEIKENSQPVEANQQPAPTPMDEEARVRAAAMRLMHQQAKMHESQNGAATEFRFKELTDPRGRGYGEIHAELTAFYKKYNPAKVDSVGELLDQYGDAVVDLYRALELKYVLLEGTFGHETIAAASEATTAGEHPATQPGATAASPAPGDGGEGSQPRATSPVKVRVEIPAASPPAEPEGSPEAAKGGCTIM